MTILTLAERVVQWVADRLWLINPPILPGQTLRERYPPAPGAFVTHYSSIDLKDEDFARHARVYDGHGCWIPLTDCDCEPCTRRRQQLSEEAD